MSFILLTSSLSAQVFAGGNDDMLSLKASYPRKSTDPKKINQEGTNSSLWKKRQVAQKAFLIALLCSLDIDVKVYFKSSTLSTYDNFSIAKVGNLTVDIKRTNNNSSQLKALIQCVSENMKNVKFNLFSKSSSMIFSAAINDYLLNQGAIYETGVKIFEIIQNKRKSSLLSKTYVVNLTQDRTFKRNVSNALGDLLTSNHDKDENICNFFELPSSSKKLESITNPVHVRYLKEHPENSSLVSICYQETFLEAILSAFGINISVKPHMKTAAKDFPKCVRWLKINKFNIQEKSSSGLSLAFIIKCIINEKSPPDKLKIETVETSYSMPIKVTIGNSIVLNENDVFNLGQRFYNLIYEMLSKGILKSTNPLFSIHLQQSCEFVRNVKKIFKEYTGKDLPDIKL